MNQQQLLTQLKDIHTPPAISMRPETLGWVIVFCIIILAFIYSILYFYKKSRQRHRQKINLQVLQHILDLQKVDSTAAIIELSILLRRIALAKYKRIEVASLQNQAWLNFLDQEMQTKEFSQGIGKILITAPYQQSVDIDVKQLITLVKPWLKEVLS